MVSMPDFGARERESLSNNIISVSVFDRILGNAMLNDVTSCFSQTFVELKAIKCLSKSYRVGLHELTGD